MRVITCNTNGIRAAERKGFFPWEAEQQADVICIQETKAQVDQLDPALFYPEGYHCFYNDAEKKGYSGTALYSRVKPKKVITKLGCEPVDNEGRYLQADFDKLSVISLYVPSGSSGEASQARKEIFMEAFFEHLRTLRRKRREFIICADWNICLRPIDLKNDKANQKNSG
ncbi:MAG: endonuclease/exonuclease/phosphatase family protein, partial [Henriciella sp.]|nr:endonuclease/exonuclease/phosphatase family protein [Henriciella sp.]